jgi:hypothetical protein
MKKQFLFSLITFLLSQYIFAQGYNFEWAKQLGGSDTEMSIGLAVDKYGNCYTIGYFAGTTDFDPGPNVYNLTSTGNNYNIFIQKSDKFGNFVWAKQMRGINIGGGYGYAISLDSLGNIYTVGAFFGTVDFDPSQNDYFFVSDVNNPDIYIQKLDASGNLIWAKRMGGPDTDYGYSIAIDPSGNIYTTGEFKGTANFDPGNGVYNLNSAGGNDIFIQKLDTFGKFIWAKQIGGTLDDLGNSITIDQVGDVYITGQFSDTVDFAPSVNPTILISEGNYSTFISKIDLNGNFIWSRQIAGTGLSSGTSIVVDSYGDIYSTGYYGGEIVFNVGMDEMTVVSNGQSDMYIEKLDALGHFIWAKTVEDAFPGGANTIATDLLGHVYLAGGYLNATDFDLGPGTNNLSFSGFMDLFIMKLDGLGNFLWALGTGSSDAERISGMAISANGNIYATGIFRADVDFDPSPATAYLNVDGSGNYDVFTLKFSQLWDFHGTVFQDLNLNNLQDSGEPGMPSIILTTTNSERSASTDSLGHYHIYNDIIGDTVIANMPRTHWSVFPHYAIPDTTQQAMNFAVEMESGIQDVSITAVQKTPFRPGFETELIIHVTNYSTIPIDSFYITLDSFNFPTPLVFLSAFPAPNYLAGNLLTWKLDTLGFLHSQEIHVYFLTPSTVTTGSQVTFPVRAILANDNFPADNSYQVVATVVGSYDPNDKQVNPEYITPSMLDSTTLRYVIRFQNTGNYPADFVYILDKLPSGLDISSLQIISASHPYTWRFYDDRMLEVAFNPIHLPDSFTNEPGSHGFVAFTIKPKKGLIEGDWISNQASIYFDYNSPIYTNSAVTKVVKTVKSTEINNSRWFDFDLIPNPAAEYSKILLNVPLEIWEDQGTEIIITNMQGTVIQEISQIKGSQSVFLNGLPSGSYIVEIRNRKFKAAKLLIVK